MTTDNLKIAQLKGSWTVLLKLPQLLKFEFDRALRIEAVSLSNKQSKRDC